jgi:hypothetical protein
MRVKREKSVITGFDFKRRAHLPTTGILVYRGEPLANLPADEAFAYLGVRASLVPPSHHAAGAEERKCKAGLAPCLKTEKDHVIRQTKEITGKIRHHKYLLCQMVPAMRMVAASRFRQPSDTLPR